MELHTLLVEDDESDTILVREMLRERSVRIQTADTLQGALDLVGRVRFDVALLDLGLPDSQGVATYRSFAAASPDLPVLVLTGDRDERVGLEAVRMGAQDFLLKDEVSGPLLDRTLRYAVERAHSRCRTEHLNTVLRALRALHRLIAREDDPVRLSRGACELLVRTRGFTSAWIRLERSRGLPPQLLAYPGPVGQDAAGQGPPCLAPDLLAKTTGAMEAEGHCASCPMRGDHGSRGRPVVVPLRRNGLLIGALGVRLPPHVQFNDQERELLEDLANDLTVALQGLLAMRRSEAAEGALVLRERELSALYDHAPVCLLLVDERLRVVRCNRQVRELHGTDDGELEGKPLCEVLRCSRHPRSCRGERCPLMQLVDEALRTGSPASRPEVEASFGGIGNPREQVLLATAAPVSLVGEQRVLLCLQDISELRALQARLLHSQRLEAMGLLAGGIAHDFNNLMAVVLSSAEHALNLVDGADPTALDLEEIISAMLRGRDLVRQLLTFSRRGGIEGEIIDLGSLVRELERNILRLLGERITLTTHSPPGLPPTWGDRGQLEQILINLAVNARDAMPDGGTLAIRLGRLAGDDENPEALLVEVEDTGCGMAPELAERIFEPFFTTKDVGEGTGLGLSTAYGIAARHDGALSVHSVEGQGTTFCLRLPVYHPPLPAEPEPPSPSRRSHRARGGTLLIVDDNNQLRRALTRSLTRAGYEVLQAESGHAALAMIEVRGQPPDLLITDQGMPGMSGTQLSERVRERWPSCPILLISGYAEGQIEHDELPFLAKPFQPHALLERVRLLLEDAPPVPPRRLP